MLEIAEGCITVGDEDHLVVHLHGVTCGRFAAHVGGRTSNDQRVDTARHQYLVQLRGAGHEGAERVLSTM